MSRRVRFSQEEDPASEEENYLSEEDISSSENESSDSESDSESDEVSADDNKGKESDNEDNVSDDEIDPDVKKNDTVVNLSVYDSSEEEDYEVLPTLSPRPGEPESESDSDLEEPDDDTDEKLDFLAQMLEEVGDISAEGKDTFKIYLSDGTKLAPKNSKCDFDINEDGLPCIYDGGQKYILPYLKELCKKRTDLKPLYISTTCNKRKYVF